jgi:hypothetical protein
MTGEYRFDSGQQHKIFWGCLPSETWRCDFGKAYPDVSKEHKVFILKSGLRPGKLPFSSNTLTSYSAGLVFKSWSRGWLSWFYLICAGKFRYCTSRSIKFSEIGLPTAPYQVISKLLFILHSFSQTKRNSLPALLNLQLLLPPNMHTEVSRFLKTSVCWLWC